jgi:hypothetical protein
MSTAEVLELARAAGISVTIDGDDQSPIPPPPDVLDALRNHKADIIGRRELGVVARLDRRYRPPPSRRKLRQSQIRRLRR